MDTDTFYFLLSFAVWMVLMSVLIFYCGKRYWDCRTEAFRSMRKIRIALYCIPLVLSILFWIFIHTILTDYYGSLWIAHVAIGAFAGVLLFDLFESERVRRSRTKRN